MMRRTFAAARRRNPYVGGSQTSNIDLVDNLRTVLMTNRAKAMAVGNTPAVWPSDENINRFSTFNMVSVKASKPNADGTFKRYTVPEAGGLHYWLGGPGTMYDRTRDVPRETRMPKSGNATWTGKGWEALAALARVGAPLSDSSGTPYSFQNLRPFDPASGVTEGTGIWSAVYETLRATPPQVLKEELEGASFVFEAISDALRSVVNGQETLEGVKPKINNFLRVMLICIYGSADAAKANRLDTEGKVLTAARQKEAKFKGGAEVSIAHLMGQMGAPTSAPPRQAAPAPVAETPAEIPLPTYAREAAPAPQAAPTGGPRMSPQELLEILREAKALGMSRSDVMRALGLE